MNKKSATKVAVLGAGNMGTAVAQVLADNGHRVKIWNWHGDLLPLRQIAKYSENKKYLPGIKLYKNIEPCEKIDEALSEVKAVFFVVPSRAVEHTIAFAAKRIPNGTVLVDVSKGIEPHTLKLITNVIISKVRPSLRRQVVTISGPAVAKQMASKKITAMNIAGKNKRAVNKIIKLVQNDYVRLVPTTDVIGVEVGGSFKNAYAIAIGMVGALGYGLNTQAALITRSLDEMSELIVKMGGKRRTVYQLAGLGDLLGTALCKESRNYRFGGFLGKGFKVKQALSKVKQTVEGVDAVYCLVKLANKYKINLPLAQVIYLSLKTKGDPRVPIKKFLKTGFGT